MPIRSLPFSVGVIGSGFIGQVHIEALQRLGLRVKALCGSESARPVKEAWGIPDLHLNYDYRPMLEDPDIGAVHIASPNRRHHQACLDALAAGKHVVCEKPLALDTGQSREIVEAAESSDRALAVNYNVRFYPLMLQLRRMIADGELGEIVHLNGSYFQDWMLLDTDFNWRVLPEEAGKLRAVGDIGTHWLDLASFVTGRSFESVRADLGQLHKRRRRPEGPVQTFASASEAANYRPYDVETEDYANALLRLEGGAPANLSVSQVASGRMNSLRLEVYGTRKSAQWHSERPNELHLRQRGGRDEILHRDQGLLHPSVAAYADLPPGHNEGFADAFKMLYLNFYDTIAGAEGVEPLFATARDGHAELALCEAILASHQSQSWKDIAY